MSSEIFKMVKELTHPECLNQATQASAQRCDELDEFFSEKIDIYAAFEDQAPLEENSFKNFDTHGRALIHLGSFKLFKPDVVEKAMLEVEFGSPLDPCPLFIFFLLASTLSPFLSQIF